MSKNDWPVVVMVGSGESLNGRVLTEVQGVLNTDVVGCAFLDPASSDTQKQKLVEYLAGCLQVDFGDPQEIFLEVTGRKAGQVNAVCVDVGIQLGESFKNGDYAEIEEVFPGCRWLFLCCKHNRVIEVHLLEQEDPLAVAS